MAYIINVSIRRPFKNLANLVTDQAIYRSGSSALGTVWSAIRISWAWRNRARYGTKSQNLASCNLYPATSLPYTTDSNAACPFGGNRCVLGDQSAFQMRTPWLNSHVHFGINAPPADRIEYRRTTTCSVINVTDLVSSVQTASGIIYSWHLGYTGSLTARTNVTYMYNDNTVNLDIGYTIRSGFSIMKFIYR
jgi:hypothetical protein